MPEKPEVITVANKLKLKLLGRTFEKVEVFHDNIIEYPSVEEFKEKLVGQKINEITTRGKWIVMKLDKYLLLVHLRMEGKFFYRTEEDPKGKHEHVFFTFDNKEQLRFADVRKFGKMLLLSIEDAHTRKPFTELGYEAWDKELTPNYLTEKFSHKSLPIKTTLLDQTIITGIGNIYADEILFLSKLNPQKKSKDLNTEELEKIIKYTKEVLDKAIAEGGTTIRSYTSEEGVTGMFQNNLHVHAHEKDPCPVCKSIIVKIKVGGRGTYYCPKCQTSEEKQSK